MRLGSRLRIRFFRESLLGFGACLVRSFRPSGAKALFFFGDNGAVETAPHKESVEPKHKDTVEPEIDALMWRQVFTAIEAVLLYDRSHN
jgi:hypothetical protein